MRAFGRRFALLGASTCLALVTTAAFGGTRENMGITSVEIAQLPTFCWGSLEVPNSTGAQFNFPASCGPGMNHYCGGLVKLIRAKHAPNKQQRMSLLGGAATDIRYTENAMKDFPGCPIRDHVAASKVEVNNIIRLYGGAAPSSPAVPK